MSGLRNFAVFLGLFLFLCAPVFAARPVSVSSIQYSSGKHSTKIAIVLTEKPRYRVNPGLVPLSLQIELSGAVLSPLLPQFLPVNDGRVKGIESFQYAAETAKVTIGLEDGAAYSISYREAGGFVLAIVVTDKVPAAMPGH